MVRAFSIAGSACAAIIAGAALMFEARAAAPKGQYTYAAGSTVVFDNYTRLTWQRGASSEAYTWSGADAYCTALTLEGRLWRLPQMRELATLVDSQSPDVAIDRAAFPDTASEKLWSASLVPDGTNNAWTVDFTDGSSFRDGIASLNRVRCVAR